MIKKSKNKNVIKHYIENLNIRYNPDLPRNGIKEEDGHIAIGGLGDRDIDPIIRIDDTSAEINLSSFSATGGRIVIREEYIKRRWWHFFVLRPSFNIMIRDFDIKEIKRKAQV